MSLALGKVFVGLLIFQTLMIILPYGHYNAGTNPGQYQDQAQNKILGLAPKRWTEVQIAGSNVVYAAGLVVPVLVASEGATPVSRFVTGFGLWLVSKAWQAYKNGIINGYNKQGKHNNLYRIFDMYQVVVETTSWGVMASAFVP